MGNQEELLLPVLNLIVQIPLVLALSVLWYTFIFTPFGVQEYVRTSAGTPTRAITEISGDIKLIPIDGTVADRLTEQYNGYVKHTIKANTYDGQTEDIETLGVKMVLIASDKMSDDRVKSITKNIFGNSNKFGFAKDDTFDMNFATENVTIPFHKGASEYYAENGVNVATE